MNLQMSMEMWQVCVVCGQSIHDHDRTCAIGILKEAVERIERNFLECSECSLWAVDVNKADFYECRECHAQFTASFLSPCGDATDQATHPRRLLRKKNEDIVAVALLPKKGDGRFGCDKLLDDLRQRRDAAVREAKNRKQG